MRCCERGAVAAERARRGPAARGGGEQGARGAAVPAAAGHRAGRAPAAAPRLRHRQG